MTLALLCPFTAEYISDVNTSIFRSLRLFGALLCRLYCAVMIYIYICNIITAHYSLHNNAPSSRKLLKMDVLTSEIYSAVNGHNKASVIKLVYLYSYIKIIVDNNAPNIRKLLKMDVLTSETC